MPSTVVERRTALVMNDPPVGPAQCPVTHTLRFIGGKWKPVILFLVRKGCNRFGALQRAIDGISKQMLTTQLRELERDGILSRTIHAEIPPRVEYHITPKGESLLPVVDAMSAWGLEDMGGPCAT
ncbi:MAG: helix-turn-helix transcriptional regulator [Flavobacteriales bacterium]|nr:helix-turn-helix transcriptional regulator [Flavobacteriales bacterium]